MDRLASIADRQLLHTPDPRYIYQVPLSDLPGVGPKMYKRLLETFGTEMAVLHQASEEELVKIAGEKTAEWILSSRTGKLVFQAGGGGVYGRVVDILS
jgi:PHP family Zn ribbon phosphoesterase